MKVMSGKKVVQTYWIGEFGHELMCWQAHLRYYSDKFDFIVTTRSGNEFLYRDFAKEIHTYDLINNPDGFNGNIDEEHFSKHINYIGLPLYEPTNIGFFPTKDGFIINEGFKKQKFIPLVSDVESPTYDIILHARSRSLAKKRNWDYEKWVTLIDMLKADGYTIGSIGIEGDADMFISVQPHFNIPLNQTIGLLNNAKLCIGPSSGAMHLASLAGTNHLVWSEMKNRSRYETLWNPLNTPVTFLSDGAWNPSVNYIYDNIKKIL